MTDAKPKCPIQDGDDIPMWLAELVYRSYSATHGTQQSLATIIERGGFGRGEVVVFLTQLGLSTFEAWKHFEEVYNA